MKPSLTVLAIVLAVVAVGCNGQPGEPKEATVADVLAVAMSSSPMSEQAASDSVGLHRPRSASGFVPANPDTRSPLQFAQAACQAATWSPDDTQKGWRCGGRVPKPTVFAASSGQTPILPVSWTVPAWFVNKSTGSDTNACTTALTACATKQEIWVHRLGAGVDGPCPRFQQTTTLEQDASDTDNTDPLYLCSATEKGATLIIEGGAPSSTAAVFTRNTQKSRAVGTNALLSGSFSAGSPAVGVLVTNTTAAKSSKAWVYKTAGGANWNLTQPLAPTGLPPLAAAFPAEIDTWATNDTVTLSTPVAINVVSASGIVGDFNGAGSSGVYLYNMTLFDPAGIALDQVLVGANTHIVESKVQRWISLDGENPSGSLYEGRLLVNNFMQGGFFNGGSTNGDPQIAGGAIPSTGFLSANFIIADGDFIDGASINSLNSSALLGFMFMDANIITVEANIILTNPGGYGQGILYGNGTATLNLRGSSHFANRTGNTFANSLTAPGLVTGILLNGTTNASCNTGADPGVIHNATTTPAHLDAACGAGTGLGSAAFLLGGASVANF